MIFVENDSGPEGVFKLISVMSILPFSDGIVKTLLKTGKNLNNVPYFDSISKWQSPVRHF